MRNFSFCVRPGLAGEVAGCEKASQGAVEPTVIATFQAREVIEDGVATGER
jgi:hypothetical protein